MNETLSSLSALYPLVELKPCSEYSLKTISACIAYWFHQCNGTVFLISNDIFDNLVQIIEQLKIKVIPHFPILLKKYFLVHSKNSMIKTESYFSLFHLISENFLYLGLNFIEWKVCFWQCFLCCFVGSRYTAFKMSTIQTVC